MKPINELTEEELENEIAKWLFPPEQYMDILFPPKFTRCHNAIASARERLTDEQKPQFVLALHDILHNPNREVFTLIHASPLIQARAMVQVIREGRG